MRLSRAAVFAGVSVFLSELCTLPARADFLLAREQTLVRYSNAGLETYVSGTVGESINGMAQGPDGLVYFVTNNFGFAGMYRFDPSSNEVIYDESVSSGGAFTGAIKIPGYTVPDSFAFGSQGDIFAISTEWSPDPLVDWESRVLRIDGQTGLLKQTLDSVPQTPKSILIDVAVASNGDLYVAEPGGRIQHHINIGDFTFRTDTIETGLSSIDSMAFAADGLLCLAANDSIVRLDVGTKTIVDTWPAPIPIGGDIFFGAGGDLFAYSYYPNGSGDPLGNLARFDATSGAFLGTLDLADDELWGNGVYLVVPEPHTASILSVAALAIRAVRRRKWS